MKKKKYIMGVVLSTLLFANVFSSNTFASEMNNYKNIAVVLDASSNELVINVNTDEELNSVLKAIEQNNNKVDKLWEKAMDRADNEQNLLATKASTYYSENIRIRSIYGFNGYHSLRGYTYTDSDGTKRFSSYSSVDLVPNSSDQSVSRVNHNVKSIDSSRTYAVRTSAYVTIKSSSGGTTTEPLEIYSEFYASGGGQNIS